MNPLKLPHNYLAQWNSIANTDSKVKHYHNYKLDSNNQRNIKADIAVLGDALQKISVDTAESHINTLLDGVFMDLIIAINQAPDAGHVSDLFGSGTTNREENFYLMMTAVESAHIEADVKDFLLEILHNEAGTNRGENSYFTKYNKIEEEYIPPTSSNWKVSRPLGAPTDRNIAIGDKNFRIEHTTTGKIIGNQLDNDCLAYALKENNNLLKDDFRSKTFTSTNIEGQIRRLVDQQKTNSKANSTADNTKDFHIAASIVSNNYPHFDYDDLIETCGNIKDLSQLLSTHICKSHCMLDSFIAAGIIAHQNNHPIVVVSKNEWGDLTFNVLNSKGVFLNERNDLSNVNPKDIENAKYIYNPLGMHFERMVLIPDTI